jgi:hypothetical protein
VQNDPGLLKQYRSMLSDLGEPGPGEFPSSGGLPHPTRHGADVIAAVGVM